MRKELIKNKKNLRSNLKQSYEDKVVREIRRNAREIQEEGIRSAKFWATIRKIKNRNRQGKVDQFVINDKGDRIEEKEIAMRYIENFYTTLYEVGKMNPEYQTWTNNLNESNKAYREHIREKMKGGNIEELNRNTNEENYPFTLEDINRALRTLRNRKATGPDGITNEFIKHLNMNNRVYLVQLINRLFNSLKVPPSWKEGTLTTMYKGKGKKGDLKNECGITVCSNMLKLMEKFIKEGIDEKM